MNLTGTITSIVPAGGYQSQMGYIYTFQMTIQCPDGAHTGEIGSKSQIYPIPVGQQIDVQVENTQYGIRFKKYNPQYAQPQGRQSPPQGQTGQQANRPQPDKDRLIVAQVVYKAWCAMHEGKPDAFDQFLAGHLPAFNRHIQTIMDAGAGKLETRYQTEPDAPEPEDMPDPVPTGDNIPF